MTLHKLKQTFVDEKKLMTSRELHILVLKVGLSLIGLGLDVIILTLNLLGMPVTLLVVFGMMFGFNWVFDLINESEEALKSVKRFSNLFVIFYVLLVVEFLVLKYFRFL